MGINWKECNIKTKKMSNLRANILIKTINVNGLHFTIRRRYIGSKQSPNVWYFQEIVCYR